MLIYLASMLTDQYHVLIISPLFQKCELYELLVPGFPTESTQNMSLPYNVTIPRLAWSTHVGSSARGPHYHNRFRNRLLILRHVDQKLNIHFNWSAALHESNCATWSNHLSTRWHHCILLFLQGAPLTTSLVKITATWWKHLSTRWHYCIYYSFRYIHVDLMHQSYFHYPQGETLGLYVYYMGKYG